MLKFMMNIKFVMNSLLNYASEIFTVDERTSKILGNFILPRNRRGNIMTATLSPKYGREINFG